MKKLIVFVVLLSLGAAGWWIARPAYRAHKVRKFAAQAHAEFTKGEYRRAVLTARQALMINPSNTVACEVMADMADMARSPQAIIWRKTIAATNPSISNQMILASCALRYEQPPFPVSSATLAALAGKADDFTPYHVVSAQFALKQNRLAEAEKHFEQAIRLEPTNQIHRLNLAVMRLQSTNTVQSAAAHQEILSLQNSPEWGATALRSLTMHHVGRQEWTPAQEYSALLLKNSRSTFDDRLEHLTILHQAKRTKEFTGFAQELRGSALTNGIWAAALALRLVACGDPVSALSLLKALPAGMQDEQPVPIALANAYMALNEWRALETYLTKQSWKEQESLRFAVLAMALRKQNDEGTAHVYWGKALQAASEPPETLALLAQTTGSWGWKAEQQEVLWRAVRTFPAERWPVETLLILYTRGADSRGLLSLYEFLLDRSTTNAVAQNNVASLRLMLRTNVAEAHQLADKVYRSDMKNPHFTSTYAWSLYVQGHTNEALRVMETISPAKLAEQSMASYYGALLAAAGQTEKAKIYLAKVDVNRLFPEEKVMVEEARAR